MTLSTLITKINSIVNANQTKVFNAKLIKGLNLTKTVGDLNNTYSSTYDFSVNGLSKNLKMIKICDNNHIRDCIPYDKIKYNTSDKEATINVSDLKTSSKLGLQYPFKDVAAFILADGTPVIVSYNIKCFDDADKADRVINSCLAGIFDTNGSRKPNKFGVQYDESGAVKAYSNDLKAFNGAYLGDFHVGYWIVDGEGDYLFNLDSINFESESCGYASATLSNNCEFSFAIETDSETNLKSLVLGIYCVMPISVRKFVLLWKIVTLKQEKAVNVLNSAIITRPNVKYQ